MCDGKIDQIKQKQVFDLQLVGIGGRNRLSLQDLIDFVGDVMPRVPLDDVVLTPSPDNLGIRIQKRDDDRECF